LPTLNSDQDITNTLASIKAAGINVVRVWAFNGMMAFKLLPRLFTFDGT